MADFSSRPFHLTDERDNEIEAETVIIATFFLSYRKLRFYTIKNAPRGSHCGGMVECRLRDPPQAENPASQDSFLESCADHDRFS